MYDENLDVVDDHDRIIDQQPRRCIHAKNLPHRAVHILVFDAAGRLFMQKRSLLKDLNKGLWDTSAAGHVDAGEDYAATAPRELYEELGVTADLHPLFKLNACPELGMEFIQVYGCRHDGPFVLNPDEIETGAWLEAAEVSARVAQDDPTLTRAFRIIWRHYLAVAAADWAKNRE